ncbi:hypothetical protein GLOIN_2v1764763 [Rhizophagus irregularis DAOM 181602=DAOM 197198]|uniref:Uncharacterized protein n=2 Tax=Rhizophagus irregularis TaxID=588596 RepID=A0A2P4QRP1_RHIID|nr:hypothetical protein GLOIN_2v1764763 [Rhizophagus irregularis DAOM 181602=DAOM 197198]POG80313.1 hypothetical protein GLOIN_2v1764763 [Rhizophagus irregularis DAOM 181602=DAOM 197198]CAG8572995.1 8371_t:CDS:2 [Rhizophagus irregularis]|eukprot:XP_025187179.1 hypothetical protein GLOIN_2v1764763 [Rhizophagus irregularis DAOM 181602=DAOM 197198]
MESERSNNTPPRVPFTIEEEIFGPQYEGILDGNLPYRNIQLTAPTNSQRESAQEESDQGESETCSLCNEPDPLFEPNGTSREIVLYDMSTLSLIYLGDDDDARLNPQEEDGVKKFFKELSNRPQDFNPLPVANVETGTLQLQIWLSRAEYGILDSHYSLGEALEKKLAEFASIHPLQTARILLNVEIKRQFPSDMSCNIFNKKKRSAKNIYNIFKTEGLGRDEIKRIRRISPSSFGKFTDKEIKIIQERIRTNSSRPNWLEDQFDGLDLNEDGYQC